MKIYQPAIASCLFAALGLVIAQPVRADQYLRLYDPATLNNATFSLADALTQATKSNLTLREMQSAVRLANASTRAAEAMTKPSVSTTVYGTLGDSSNILTNSPGVSPQNIFSVPPHGFADFDLTLMAPLSTGGKLNDAVDSAKMQSEAAGFDVQASQLTVSELVTESYVNAVLDVALVDVAKARVAAEDEQVRVTQEKVTTGRSAPVELLREQAEQADADQGVLNANNDVALALVSLKSALGISQNSQIVPSDTLESLSGDVTTSIPSMADALRAAEIHRPELSAARAMIESAQAEINQVRGSYRPQIYGVAMGDLMSGQGSTRAGYTIGVTASLPLYEGGGRKADVDAATARQQRSDEDAQQARQSVDAETASAWLNLQTAMSQVQVATAGVTAAQESYTLSNLRYNAGKSVVADRLDALSALTRAQGALAQAKASSIIARCKLAVAMGATH